MGATSIEWTDRSGRAAGAMKVEPVKHPRATTWKGGRSVASNGYVLVRVGKDHHLADVRGYAYEHRLVAERILGIGDKVRSAIAKAEGQ